ncbi:unnamed protein product, partial [Musa textilis]
FHSTIINRNNISCFILQKQSIIPIGRSKIITEKKKKGILLLIRALQGSIDSTPSLPLHFPSHLHITCTFVLADSCTRQRE